MRRTDPLEMMWSALVAAVAVGLLALAVQPAGAQETGIRVRSVRVLAADPVALADFYKKAFGNRASKPDAVAMTTDTVFDMASLTKPVATGTSVMLLIQQGKLKPDDLVSKHWPGFAANGKEKVTVALNRPDRNNQKCE